jgi:hypothetical protein
MMGQPLHVTNELYLNETVWSTPYTFVPKKLIGTESIE